MNKRSFAARLGTGLLLAVVTLTVASCGQRGPYYYSQNQYDGHTIPPSGLLQRVLASYTVNGSAGGLEILDGLRDLRSNVQDTIPAFFVTGFSEPEPLQILNYPEQQVGLIRSQDGSLISINYAKEVSGGGVASFGANSPSAAAAPDFTRYVGVDTNTGQILISTVGATYALTLPNVDKVVVNPGDTVILAMVRNSDALYRLVKLPQSANPVFPPGYIDCEPIQLPVYCVLPVPGTYARPVDATFSIDGSSVYILNCGPECGGTAPTASVSFLSTAPLTVNVIPTSTPYPSPMLPLPVANPVPIPGGVTAALSDGITLYLAGQQLQPDGLLAGFLTTLNLASYTVTNSYSISDGHHSKLLFADDSTLWIAAQQCASGERAAHNLNTNCLSMVTLGTTPLATPQIVPNVTPGGPITVAYPNNDNNLYYYGSVTGLCWIQTYHKVYTADGGQIHAFYTGTVAAAGTEVNNTNVTVQGTVLDVAYMDADTNAAN